VQPTIHFLTQEMVDKIISEGIALLADPGVRVHNHEALQLLADGGADVDFVSETVSIPDQLVWKSLKTAPGEFSLYNLNGLPVVSYGGSQVHFDPGSAAVTILDRETGEQRPPHTMDFVRFVRLVEALPQLDAQSTAFVCRDVPQGIGDLYRLYLALNYMCKPIVTGAFRKDTWWVMWEMLAVAAGGTANLAAKPLAVFDVCPTPPLTWSDLTCQNLIDCARKGVPAQLVSMPLAGVTSPVTLAAAVVQHTAESLSGFVISQLAKPGAPVVWGGAPAAVDMRTGATPMGDVNTWLLDCSYIQVGKFLGLPTHTYMGSSDAKILDAQCGMESGSGTILAALAGANMVSGAGMIDFLRCQSPEKLLIDAEMIGMTKRLLAGITFRDQPVALELMRISAHKADHMGRTHTLKNFAKELYIPSEVMDRGSLEAWKQKGQQSSFQRAHKQIEKLLENPSPSPLSTDIRRELRNIASSAARQHGMDELPALPE
jgi:trimethylamine---corrinoid protein Co-methyltransferase